MDFGKIATKGQKHIPAAAWNAMREVAQQFENGLPSFELTSANRNPFLITIENATGASIEPFAVLEISDAMFPNRTGTDFLNEAINRGVELKGIKPSGDEEKNIAITLDGGPNGTLVQAVVVGAVPCMIAVSSSEEADYKYAVPVENRTDELKAVKSGNIRILWKESGYGSVKWAYVLLNQYRFVMHCLNQLKVNDNYPDGATPSYGAVYCDELDSVAVDNDFSPKVYNPLGLPEYHRSIIAKVDGFPGEAESSDTPGGRKVGDYVAISADTRDYVILTTSNLSAIDRIKSDNNWILEAGDCIYVNSYYTDPNARRYWKYGGTSFDNIWYNMRLVVCQRSIPKGYDKDFIMPIYPVECNMGIPPKADPLQFNSNFYQNRCGIDPENTDSVTLKNQVWDYVWDGGRYRFDPRFDFYTVAVDPSTVQVETSGDAAIGGNVNTEFNYGIVAFKFLDDKYYSAPGYRMSTGLGTWFGADIWAGDTIKVHCNTHGRYGPDFAIIEYPIDYRDGMVIANYSDNIGSQRGWVPADFNDTYGQDLPANPTGNYILGLYGGFGYNSLPNYISGQTPEHTELNGFTAYGAYNIKWYKKTKKQGNANALV